MDIAIPNSICNHLVRKQGQQDVGEGVVNIVPKDRKTLLEHVAAEVLVASLAEDVLEDIAAEHVLEEGHAEYVIAKVFDK